MRIRSPKQQLKGSGIRLVLVFLAIVILALTMSRHEVFIESTYVNNDLGVLLESEKKEPLATTVTATATTQTELVPPTTAIPSTMTDQTDAITGLFGDIFNMKGRPEKWDLWNADKKQVFSGRDDNVTCEWTNFKPHGSPQTTSRICIYPVETDIWVSKSLKKDGRWGECNALVNLWKEATEQRGAGQRALESNKTMIYLDLGGNIGSCAMEMLHSTNAKIVVFEPHPHNLMQLTTTIQGQSEELRKRVVVIPIGVGDTTGNFTLNMAADNRGNSVIGQVIKDGPGQKFLKSAPIFVERLDDIFNAKKVEIPLMKMDIQGFECKAWDGMISLLPSIDIIFTEAEHRFLVGQGCSPQELKDRIAKAGFTFRGSLNLIAKRNRTHT